MGSTFCCRFHSPSSSTLSLREPRLPPGLRLVQLVSICIPGTYWILVLNYDSDPVTVHRRHAGFSSGIDLPRVELL
jgi:hypothetical protein